MNDKRGLKRSWCLCGNSGLVKYIHVAGSTVQRLLLCLPQPGEMLFNLGLTRLCHCDIKDIQYNSQYEEYDSMRSPPCIAVSWWWHIFDLVDTCYFVLHCHHFCYLYILAQSLCLSSTDDGDFYIVPCGWVCLTDWHLLPWLSLLIPFDMAFCVDTVLDRVW